MELRYWERWSAEQPPLPMVYLPIGWSVHFWRRRHEGIEDLAPRQAIINIDWVRGTHEQGHPRAGFWPATVQLPAPQGCRTAG